MSGPNAEEAHTYAGHAVADLNSELLRYHDMWVLQCCQQANTDTMRTTVNTTSSLQCVVYNRFTREPLRKHIHVCVYD